MERLKKIYTYMLPIIIILNGYTSGIPGLTLGAIVMNCFNVIAIISFFMANKKADLFFVRTIILLGAFSCLSCVSFFWYGIFDGFTLFVSIQKVITWFVGITFTSRMLFDYSIFRKYYVKFCCVCTLYLYIQVLSWRIMHIYIPNIFDFAVFHPMYEQYSSDAYVNYLSSIGIGRFSSFFAEPAYYGIMVVIGLIILLFDSYKEEQMIKKTKTKMILLVSGIWLSTSTASIIFVIFIFSVYFFKTNMVNKFILIMIVINIGVVSFIYFADNALVGFFVEKVTTMSSSGRVGQSYSEINKLSLVQKILGVGQANEGLVAETSYRNEFTGIIMEYGLVGFLLFIWYMFSLYRKEKSTTLHVIVIVHLAAMAQGGYFFNLFGILFFSIAQNIKGKDRYLLNNNNTESI